MNFDENLNIQVMKSLITFLSFLFISFSIYAQKNTDNGRVSGVITDNMNEPLPYATVVLKNIKKEIIEGTVTKENGGFTFTKLNEQNYFLEILIYFWQVKKLMFMRLIINYFK